MQSRDTAAERMKRLEDESRSRSAADAPRRAAFGAAIERGDLAEARTLMTEQEWGRYEAHMRGAWERADAEHLASIRRLESAERTAREKRAAVALAELQRRAASGDESASTALEVIEARREERARLAKEEAAAALEAQHADVSTADLAAALGDAL